MLEIKSVKEGVQFKVKVQPRASSTRLSGIINGAIKLHLTSPPVDGEANSACLKFLAKQLDVPKSNIKIVSGETSRNKIIQVSDRTVEEIREKLLQ